MKVPDDHPQRIELNDEVHARPPEPLVAPSRLSYLALLCDAAQRDISWLAVCDLCRRYGIEPPAQSGLHFTAELGPFRLKWERHTEFIRYMFIVEGTTGDPFERPAITVLPEGWVAALLNSLTRLEAEIEHQEAQTRYRFGAPDAYYGLMQRRIDELREHRIQELQTFREFTERRLAPAMNTCRSVAARQESLSQRVARATRLLSTRVDLTTERQNQALLESMNSRARLQSRLQSTVEGLSVAAVTYYVSALVGHTAEALRVEGVRVDPDLATGISIPIVAVIAWFGIHHIRRMVTRPTDG